MALTALDLLAPSAGGTGELPPELARAVKPTDAAGNALSASAALSGYIADADGKTAGMTDAALQQRAAVAYAHAQVYRTRATQILTASLAKGADGASVSYSVAQAQALDAKAAAWEVTYTEAVAADAALAAPPAPLTYRVLPSLRYAAGSA